MNYIDYVIISLILIFGIVGLLRGLFKTVISFAGFIVVVVLAFYLKNPIATFMYEKLPFFTLKGIFNGVTVLNIIIYEAIAFLIVAAILGVILKVIMIVTNILDKVLNIFIFMGLPSKILGFVVGLIEGYIISFIVLFVSVQLNYKLSDIDASKYGNKILKDTPFISSIVKNTYDSFMEIYNLRSTYENTDKYNEVAFETLIKNKVLSIKSAKKLVETEKVKINNADEIIKKYEKGDE